MRKDKHEAEPTARERLYELLQEIEMQENLKYWQGVTFMLGDLEVLVVRGKI